MSEEEIIKIIKEKIILDFNCYNPIDKIELEAIEGLLELYNKEKEKNKEKVIFKNASIKIGDKDLKDILENYILKSKVKEKIEEYHHKDFIKVQVCYQHDNEARIKEEALRELLEEGE